MRKLHFITMVLSFLLLVNNQLLNAQDAPSGTKATVDVSKLQDVGNKICPVTGEEIDEKTRRLMNTRGRFIISAARCVSMRSRKIRRNILKI